MFGNSSSNTNWWSRFSFLKQPCRKTHGHIPGWQCQDSSGLDCDYDYIRYYFHSWIGTSRPYGSLWDGAGGDITYRVLDSCIDNTRSWAKTYGINLTMFISIKSCIHFWSGSCHDLIIDSKDFANPNQKAFFFGVFLFFFYTCWICTGQMKSKHVIKHVAVHI